MVYKKPVLAFLVGITQSKISTPRFTASTMSSGVPTPIKYLTLSFGILQAILSKTLFLSSEVSPTDNPPIAYPSKPIFIKPSNDLSRKSSYIPPCIIPNRLLFSLVIEFFESLPQINDKSKELGAIKIAEGVMATANRVKNNEIVKFSSHGYEKETILEKTATIYFTVNQSNVRYSQKSSNEIKELKEFARLGYKTKNIEIASFASPEGTLVINDKVSDNRSKSTFNYAKRLMRQIKIDGYNNDAVYIKSSVGEDWNGFNSLMQSSKMKDKSKVLNVVRNQKDPQKREEAIRDMSEIYDAIENDVLPKLRKATITIRSYQPKKSDEEIAELSFSDPSKLDIKELLYAAHSNKDNEQKIKIYNTINSLVNVSTSF